MDRAQLLFVTGRLAEPSLRHTLEELAPKAGFDYGVAVLPISVVALATTPWIARHLTVGTRVERVILPGSCQGDLAAVRAPEGVSVERGPVDLRDLPDFFRVGGPEPVQLGRFDIEILAEINHAPRLDRAELMAEARKYRAEGAEVIDLGCDPGSTWSGIRDAVRALRDEGLRVSVDSFDPVEVRAAVDGGAELVLSVNATNAAAAGDWGCEVVVLPDDLATLGGLDRTVDTLVARGVRFRLDPVIEPIGLGFAASLGRYLEVRRRYPDAEIMMGVGNLTELTDVDSAGINVLLLGFCQEIGVRSVLTTEVINWARTSVRELDLARRMVHYACTRHVVPKRVQSDLITLRDPKLRVHGETALAELAERIRDRNFRLFAERGRLHVLNGSMHLQGEDPFELFAAMSGREAIDPSHAFYLGYEMAKAVIALTLGKNYAQDQALRWGFLTVPEESHRGKMPEGEDKSQSAGRRPADDAP
jgi:dihydropteroate synthase-like protein